MSELARHGMWKRLFGPSSESYSTRILRSDDNKRKIKVDVPYSGTVHNVIGSTDPTLWGRLVSAGFRWSGISLSDRLESFPASKPQGYVVGRDSECDLVIDDPYVSNRHCLIYRVARYDQACVFLRDLSSNGTVVNGNVVGCNQVLELKDRDEITIVDSVRFMFGLAQSTHHTFDQKYTLLDSIGTGNLGQVFACQEKSTGERFAVKRHSFSSDPKSDQVTKESIAAELNLMGLCHRNLIFMKEAFASDCSCSLVTQIAEKGDLFELIVRKSKLSENETRHIFKQLFEAVKYLHEHNIVHRDLKPENMLILDEDLSIVLCSFGLSITITPQSFDTALCGSPIYVAPEVLAESGYRKYGREVDIWSLGVVLYVCLCGFPPFSDDLHSEEFPYSLDQQIKSGKFDYPSPHWDSVGDSALELIDYMLVVDPQKRFTIEQCLAHPWLTQTAPGDGVLAKSSPVALRKSTMLQSKKVVHLSTYVASLNETQGLRPEYSPSDPVIRMPEPKDKGKMPTPGPAELAETQNQGQNIYGQSRRRNPITTIDVQLHLKSLSPESTCFPKARTAIRKALVAVQLDEVQNTHGARSAYQEAHSLLNEVWRHEAGDEDKQKLEAIIKTYARRIEELSQFLPDEEQDRETHPQRLPPATCTPTHSPAPSTVKPDIAEGFDSGPEATSPAQGYADSMVPLEHDAFAFLVSDVVNKSRSPWTTLSTQLPEDLQNDIEFNDKGEDLSTWTCTPPALVSSDGVPLRVDGYPVVLPVEYKYPLTGMFSPPPDPHPLFISPSTPLHDGDVHHILSTFPGCIGFYLLVDGFLQIIMPDDFDYEEGIPNLPSEFGGLKVSLIAESVCPTAGEASASSPAATTTSTRARLERMFGQSPTQSSVAGSVGHHSANAAGISVGSTIRAIVPGSKSKQRFEGKIGVAVTPRDDNSKKYVTISTHLLTDSVIASKTMSLGAENWRKDIKVCVASNSIELGEITTIFDQDPRSFPIGFSHDVSLVDISGTPDAPRTIPYATDLTWLSQQEWMDIKYNSSNLVLLDDRSREAKSIGVVDSRCQMVGQGIFRIQQQSRKRSSFLGSLSSGSSSSRTQDPRNDPSTWTSLVARSILYRVHPDYPARGGQSGVPVCVVSESTDGTAPRSVKVAGFASFVQMVSDVQKYDLEGDRLYKRLQEGRVAFYGAFQVPQELREGYQIL